MDKLTELTINYWKTNNCSYSTSKALLEFNNEYDAVDIIVPAMMVFGEGMGERSICGSVTGTMASMSYILHKRGVEQSIIKSAINDFKLGFNTNFKTLNCIDLLSPYLDKNEPYPDDPTRLDICNKAIKFAVKSAQEILDSIDKSQKFPPFLQII